MCVCVCVFRKRSSRCTSVTAKTSLALSYCGDRSLIRRSFRYSLTVSLTGSTVMLMIGHRSTLSVSLPLQECQKKLEHKLGLDSYLLKPVQRLTKYQLLLKVLSIRGSQI